MKKLLALCLLSSQVFGIYGFGSGYGTGLTDRYDSPAFTPTAALTMCVRFNRPSAACATASCWAFGSAAVVADAINSALLMRNTDNTIRFFRRYSTTSGEWKTTTTITAGVDTHVCATYDSTGGTSVDPTFYWNGAVDTTVDVTAPVGTVALTEVTLRIGNNESSSPSRPWGGYVGDVAWWNRVLSAGEIAYVYQTEAACVPHGLESSVPLIRELIDVMLGPLTSKGTPVIQSPHFRVSQCE
jgi:hypothetical protein